jgi:hypothetical protein
MSQSPYPGDAVMFLVATAFALWGIRVMLIARKLRRANPTWRLPGNDWTRQVRGALLSFVFALLVCSMPVAHILGWVNV